MYYSRCLNPIPSQALGYAEYVRGEQIHPKTLEVNTAFILQGIQFFCPFNKLDYKNDQERKNPKQRRCSGKKQL